MRGAWRAKTAAPHPISPSRPHCAKAAGRAPQRLGTEPFSHSSRPDRRPDGRGVAPALRLQPDSAGCRIGSAAPTVYKRTTYDELVALVDLHSQQGTGEQVLTMPRGLACAKPTLATDVAAIVTDKLVAPSSGSRALVCRGQGGLVAARGAAHTRLRRRGGGQGARPWGSGARLSPGSAVRREGAGAPLEPGQLLSERAAASALAMACSARRASCQAWISS